jgi:serine/threonine protein kinase
MNNAPDRSQFMLLANVPAGTAVQVGPWEVIDPLAYGAFGETYVVKKNIPVGSAEFEVTAVLKMVRTNIPNVNEAINSLIKEMRNLSQINSRYVAKFIDGGVHLLGNRYVPYIVVDYIEGHSLQAQLQNRRSLKLGPLTPAMFRSLAENTLRALRTAHAKDVLHLDIKPGNIIYNESDAAYVLIDFGLAEIHHRETLNKFVGGTNGYIAPEAFIEQTTKATDVFALGVTFYESLTGINPIRIEFIELAKKHGDPMDGDFRLAQLAVNNAKFDFSKINDDQRLLVEPMLYPDPKQRPSLEKLIDLAGQLHFEGVSKQFASANGAANLADLWSDVRTEIVNRLKTQKIEDVNLVIDHEKYYQIWFKTKFEEGLIQLVCNKPRDHLRLGALGWVPNKQGSLKFVFENAPTYGQLADTITDAIRVGFSLTFPFDIS